VWRDRHRAVGQHCPAGSESRSRHTPLCGRHLLKSEGGVEIPRRAADSVFQGFEANSDQHRGAFAPHVGELGRRNLADLNERICVANACVTQIGRAVGRGCRRGEWLQNTGDQRTGLCIELAADRNRAIVRVSKRQPSALTRNSFLQFERAVSTRSTSISLFSAAGTPPGSACIAAHTAAAASTPISPALNAAAVAGRSTNDRCNASRDLHNHTGTSATLRNHAAVDVAPVDVAICDESARASTAI